MKITGFIFFIIIVAGFSAMAQDDPVFNPVKKITGDIIAFKVDNLDNIYLLNSSDQLKKLNPNGDSVAVFNNVRKSGKVSLIDVSNPLRVLLYYRDYGQIIMLDRLLNIRNTIDLRRQSIFQVRAVCLSYDNKIWLYDEFDHRLKKIDEDGNLLFETADFRQLFGNAFSFSSITDVNGLIYLYDRALGVYVFDYYGALKNRLPFTGIDHIQVTGQYLQGVRNDSLVRYQPSLFSTLSFSLPLAFQDAVALEYSLSKLYMLKKNELTVFDLR